MCKYVKKVQVHEVDADMPISEAVKIFVLLDLILF